MQPLQYLILAREIKKNESGIFSFMDVCLHLAVNDLPARGKFDLAIICGPGWQAGKYRIHIATKTGDQPPLKIGFAEVDILDESHIYTAVVNNLGLQINNASGFIFQVYKELNPQGDPQATQNEIVGELILERPFNVKLLEKAVAE